MSVPAPPIKWVGAHPNNFTVGRPGGSDGRLTDHHIVGRLSAADVTFQNPSRIASANFGVGPTEIHQYVRIEDTPYSDGNWASNVATISIEHEGGFTGVPYDDRMYELAAWLTAWLRENYGRKYHIDHRQISATACPGGLDTNRIWARSEELIKHYSKPAEQPEWMKNRKIVPVHTVYAQDDGLRITNLVSGGAADSRVFARNTSFEITSSTVVRGIEYWITRSSTDLNLPNGIAKSLVASKPWAPPAPAPQPDPVTPRWDDALVDEPNRKMYVLRETLLINLEDGKPRKDPNGNDVKFRAGDVIGEVSAHTIVAGITYYLTEYSFSKRIASGIRANDLSLDPGSTPPDTPSNPTIETRLAKTEADVVAMKKVIKDKLGVDV